MKKNHIILCEPQCWGFEHVPFNTALLYTILLAFPNSFVSFLAEKEHLRSVHSLLAQKTKIDIYRINWREINIPPREFNSKQRFRQELKLFLNISRLIINQKCNFLIFCSITKTGLIILKILKYLKKINISILVVFHSMLNELLKKINRNPIKKLLRLKNILKYFHCKHLYYVVLGGSIFHYLQKYFPEIAFHFLYLDHPYFWSNDSYKRIVNTPKIVCFGYFGVSSKGFNSFYKLSTGIKNIKSNCKFILVGFLNNTRDYQFFNQDIVEGVSSTPLTFEEYNKRALNLNYSIWITDFNHYNLTASATFLDALSFVKPGIYIRNPYVEYYFNKMGDIGYICNNYKEMDSVILSILNKFPVERYNKQCENILKGRKIFNPENLASQLRGIIKNVFKENEIY